MNGRAKERSSKETRPRNTSNAFIQRGALGVRWLIFVVVVLVHSGPCVQLGAQKGLKHMLLSQATLNVSFEGICKVLLSGP